MFEAILTTFSFDNLHRPNLLPPRNFAEHLHLRLRGASPQRQLRPETAPEGVSTRTNISANTAAMPSQARMIWVRPPRFGLSDAWSVSIKNAPRQWPGLRETEGYHALSSNIMQRAPAEAPSHNPPQLARSWRWLPAKLDPPAPTEDRNTAAGTISVLTLKYRILRHPLDRALGARSHPSCRYWSRRSCNILL